MRWEKSQLERYQSAKEYIDTALIPIFRLGLGERMEETLLKAEQAVQLATRAEDQLMGRVMLLPAYTYVESDPELLVSSLKAYTSYIKNNHFKHVVWIASEQIWDKYIQDIPGKWLYVDKFIRQESEQKELNHEHFVTSLIESWKNA